MKERAKDLKAAACTDKERTAEERALLEKIVEMPEPERSMAMKVHEIITVSAPALWLKTWHGMPAYARNGKVVYFFQGADMYKSRYATLGCMNF